MRSTHASNSVVRFDAGLVLFLSDVVCEDVRGALVTSDVVRTSRCSDEPKCR